MNPLRSTFLALSEQRGLRAVAERSAVGRRLSGRFVAGVRVEDAIRATRELNARGISVTLDALGENVLEEAQAVRAAGTYHALLDAIARERLDANVSLKLTQMGIDLGGGVAEGIVRKLAEKAGSIGSFVRVDMEGSAYTEATIELVRRIHAMHGKIGIVIQAYLRRSEEDVRALLFDGIRIRLCKGAYQEPAEIAFAEKAEVDANYVRLMQVLLTSGVFHGLATHDEAMVREAKAFAQAHAIAPQSFEFQ
ncbi:MAG TPA: proline dehydrogenase family protein, partial [Terracidiphilus sp.]